jgi:hypothetical protein
MTKVFIPAWRDTAADEILSFFEEGDEHFRQHMIDWGYIHLTPESAAKQAREYEAMDTIAWPIYVFEKETLTDDTTTA